VQEEKREVLVEKVSKNKMGDSEWERCIWDYVETEEMNLFQNCDVRHKQDGWEDVW
jgi:hypothetical protein